MIIVRNVFRLKFGKAREAKALWQEGERIGRKAGAGIDRMLTDVTGEFYTLVLENSYPSLAAYEEASHRMTAVPEWQRWYARFTPLVESGHREIFSVVEAPQAKAPTRTGKARAGARRRR